MLSTLALHHVPFTVDLFRFCIITEYNNYCILFYFFWCLLDDECRVLLPSLYTPTLFLSLSGFCNIYSVCLTWILNEHLIKIFRNTLLYFRCRLRCRFEMNVSDNVLLRFLNGSEHGALLNSLPSVFSFNIRHSVESVFIRQRWTSNVNADNYTIRCFCFINCTCPVLSSNKNK